MEVRGGRSGRDGALSTDRGEDPDRASDRAPAAKDSLRHALAVHCEAGDRGGAESREGGGRRTGAADRSDRQDEDRGFQPFVFKEPRLHEKLLRTSEHSPEQGSANTLSRATGCSLVLLLSLLGFRESLCVCMC